MKALLIILGVLVLLALIPLGAHVRYDADGAFVWVVAGPIRIRLLPKKPKKAKKQIHTSHVNPWTLSTVSTNTF